MRRRTTIPRHADSPSRRAWRLRRRGARSRRPLRAKYIAETFFEDAREVNAERGMLGYTGTFEGKPISVQSSGMGCPSASIVFEELVQLGVKRLVRVGTCGGLQPGPGARRPDRRDLGDAGRRHRAHLHGRRAARADRRLRGRARRRAPGQARRPEGARRRRRLQRRLLQPGRRASTSAGPTAASWRSRWRPRCCSRSARCARSRRAAC